MGSIILSFRMIVLTLLLLISGLNTTWAKTKREIIKELFDPSHYDPDSRPGEDENSGPTKIKVNLYVRDVQNGDGPSDHIQAKVAGSSPAVHPSCDKHHLHHPS